MSVLDLSGTVLELASGTYTVTRSNPGTYGTDGRLSLGSTSTFTITASVQPLNGRDLLRLPDGERTTERLKVYTPTQLFTQGAGQAPDVITVAGINYQVETAEVWGPDGNYYKLIVRSIGRQAP